MSHNRFSPKAFTMPLAAFTMAGLLLVYTRSSIRMARRNAQMEREALRARKSRSGLSDGGPGVE
ncbi:hypothetical protein TWF481_009935 [Arthrobotrys musiformis]|uniref:Transmembrane protein n=1 Tax=Arthrobotrys musiformis TaxID=47236 RepID=A0AAV9VZD5_9PEZI